MIKIVIVDDEGRARKNLSLLLEKQSDVSILAEASNAIEAIEIISKQNPDLVFLDVKMPQQTGFDVLDKLLKLGITGFDVIFLTAFDDYAIKAIKYAAFDYLLKPIDENELIETLIKYRSKQNSNLILKSEALQSIINKNQKFRIKTSGGYEFVNLDDIIYVEGDSNYSIFMMKDNSKYTVCRTLKDVSEELPINDFIRVHKAYLINKKYLTFYNSSAKICFLKATNQEFQIPVSNRLIKNILK